MLWMLLSAIGFAFMNAFGARASKSLGFTEIAFARCLIGVILLLGWARARRISLQIDRWGLLWFRALTGTVAIGFHFYSLAHFRFAEVTSLLNLTPIFVALVAAVWLGERASSLVMLCIAVAFGGVLLVVQPWSGGALGPRAMIALGAPLSSSLAMTALRQLGKHESPESIVIYFFLIAGVIMGALSLPTFVVPSPAVALLLLGTGASAAIAQLAMTHAYSLDIAARVGGMNYLNIVASVALGAVWFGEIPGPLSLLGISIILAAGGALVWSSRNELQRASQEATSE